MFPPNELNDLQPPDHLRQLPREVVDHLAGIIRSEFAGAMPYTLGLELEGFVRDRTIWDAKRLVNALRHCYGREGLSREIEDAHRRRLITHRSLRASPRGGRVAARRRSSPRPSPGGHSNQECTAHDAQPPHHLAIGRVGDQRPRPAAV